MKKQCKTALIKTYLGNCSKMFFILLPIVTGLIFCGCNGKDDSKKNSDVDVVKTADTSVTNVSESKISKSENSSNNASPSRSTKESNETVLLEKKPNKKIKSDSITVSPKTLSSKNKEQISSNKVSETPKNAEFPGGIDQFHTFFMKEYKKPEGVYYWKLNFTLAFAVEKNGAVSFLECSPAVEEPLEKEIIRVLNLCPKWLPGEANGKKIRMQYSVPILLK
ncbi:hypothetical protein [Flavobacterium hungaricum]|uniref:TonB C-terminal domain-containing protein n=1 Tax=Flavobacterium hungaricum TaxID=2082725 RepID=A0ABR9TJ58_9FLAO|nr:hypothetical protein [Flavobacterium hungaricum]MBE8725393.1 hypothetical protein [Flavobacterium hungaricum]